ncbi:MAG: transposase [Planctomycetaceae bacterium]|nr:transposase [Planctomycetaceae bacterium]
MTQSLSKIIVHAVFSTKNREPVLSKAVQDGLFAYMVGILNSLDCVTVTINGVEDHVHALIIMSKTISVSKMMAEMKGGSSRWLNSRDAVMKYFPGRPGMAHFPSANPTFQMSSNTLQHRKNVTRKQRFRTN